MHGLPAEAAAGEGRGFLKDCWVAFICSKFVSINNEMVSKICRISFVALALLALSSFG